MCTVKIMGQGCERSGHVTGQRSHRGRGSRKGLQRAPTNTMLFSDYHLAKLSYELFGLFVTETVTCNSSREEFISFDLMAIHCLFK